MEVKMIKKINNNKILMISHMADIDGMRSVILADKFYNNQVDYILAETKDLANLFKTFDFSNYDVIYLCDLPLIPSAIEALDKHEEIISKLKHFDHHSSYGGVVPNYVNAHVTLNGRKTCGTELFYNYLLSLSTKLDSPFYHVFVEATRETDTWDFLEETYNAKMLACVYGIIGPVAYIELINSLNDLEEFKLPNLFSDLYEADLVRQRSYIDFVNENLLVTTYKQYKIGVTIAEQYRSILGNEICKMRPDLDFVMILNYSRNSVSLRCVKDDVDLNQICAEFHHDGGGHKKSAGFVIDEESIPKIQEYHNEYLKKIR